MMLVIKKLQMARHPSEHPLFTLIHSHSLTHNRKGEHAGPAPQRLMAQVEEYMPG